MNTILNTTGSVIPVGMVGPLDAGPLLIGSSEAAKPDTPRKMKVTEKKVIANRENGKKGGPKTKAGKAKSSKNATRHGLFSTSLVLKTLGYEESETEYRKLVERIRNDLKPRTFLGNSCVIEIANAIWRLRRLDKFEKAVTEKQLITAWPEEFPSDGMGTPLFVTDKLVEMMAEELELMSKDHKMLMEHVFGKHIIEVPIHEQLDMNVQIRLEQYVIETRKSPYDRAMDSMYPGMAAQMASGSVLEGLDARDMLLFLDKLREKKTNEFCEMNNKHIRNMKAEGQRDLSQQLALVPAPDQLKNIGRYRAELYRIIEKHLEQFRLVEQYPFVNRESGITDAEFSEQPCDKTEPVSKKEVKDGPDGDANPPSG